MVSTKRIDLAQEYVDLYKSCCPGSNAAGAPVRDLKDQISETLDRITAHSNQYIGAEEICGVPWWFIAVIHQLESSGDFTKHLHNGDPLTARTVNVPEGRPLGEPPFTWEESASDAMRLKTWDSSQVRRLPDGRADWTLPTALWRAESYNGFGYRYKGIRSPYLWAGCQHEEPGRYVKDRVWNPKAWSSQIGVGVLMREMESKKLMKVDRQ